MSLDPKDFPVRVMSKFSGPFEGLIWYTHNDGHHLLLTKLKCSILRESEVRIADMFKAVVEKHPDAEPRQYIVASTVKPPKEMERLTCQSNMEDAVITFKNIVHCDMTLFQEKGRKLPAGWSPCKRCGGKGHVGDDYQDCPRKTCIGGFQLQGATSPEDALGQLFDPKRPMRFNWNTPREQGYTPQGYAPSMADKLYIVGGSFGDHGPGIGIRAIEHNEALPKGTLMLINGHVNVPIPECIRAIARTAREKTAAEQARWRKENQRERLAADRKLLKQALARYQ